MDLFKICRNVSDLNFMRNFNKVAFNINMVATNVSADGLAKLFFYGINACAK